MIFKKFFFVSFLSVAVYCSSYAQTGAISGTIKDEKGNYVQYATVELIKLPDSSRVNVNVSDSLGSYTFNKIPQGEYLMHAFLFGYKEIFSEAMQLGDSTVIQKDLVLPEEYLEIDEVVVTRTPPMIRQYPDKMVVNVENSISNSGLTALDVLRKSPGVTLDKDDIIQLRGKSGVLIMIDDNPVYMSDEQVANLLKSIPSDQIKEIEIITIPSAKFDAAGNGGIINIKLKKGAYEGLSGNLTSSLGYGVYEKATTGANLFYNKEKYSFSAGYQFEHSPGMEKSSLHRDFGPSENVNSKFNSDSYEKRKEQSQSILLNGKYQLSKKTKVDFNINNMYAHNQWHETTTSQLFDRANLVTNTYLGSKNGSSKPITINSNVGLTHTIDSIGSTISVKGIYNYTVDWKGDGSDIQFLDSDNKDTGESFIFRVYQKNQHQNFSAKIDYATKWKKTNFELGAKANGMTTDRPASIAITENGVVRDASNFFNYKEIVYAGYLMMNKTYKKWSMQAGMRMENTHTIGTQTLIDSTFKRNYINWFPSGGVTYNFSDETSYSLIYSRRITRPNAFQLSPIFGIYDPYTFRGGNPYLLPEFGDNVEFAYSLLTGALIFKLEYAHITNPIRWVTTIDEISKKSVSRNENIGRQDNISASVSYNRTIKPWWTSSNTLSLYNIAYVGDLGFGKQRNSQLSWWCDMNQTFTLPKNYSFEISGSYSAKRAYGLGTGLPMWRLNLGLQKKLWNNKALVKVAISDIFWTYKWTSKQTIEDTHIRESYKWENRILMFTFNYKLGKRLVTLVK